MCKVSFYKNLYDNVGVIVSLDKILEGIKKNRWKFDIDRHRKGVIDGKAPNGIIPCFTVGGVFSPKRASGNCTESSGLVSVDLDDVTDFGTVQQAIRKNPLLLGCIYTSFPSLSGKGMCLLVKVRKTTDEKEYRASYTSIYNNLVKLGVDELCKLDKLSDISRLRFVSYYPELSINTMCATWEGKVYEDVVTKVDNNYDRSDMLLVENEEVVLKETVAKYEEVAGQFGSGGKTRHDWVLGLARFLCRAGVGENTALSHILSSYHNPDRSNVWNAEVKRSVKSSYERYSAEMGSYAPKKKFSYDGILRACNQEEVLTEFLLYIVEKRGLRQWMVENGKKVDSIEKEIKFLEVFYNKIKV
jgi:hypothetical protein